MTFETQLIGRIQKLEKATERLGTWESGSNTSGGGGSSEDFLDLADTPSSYLGNAGEFVAVNSLEDGLIFRDDIVTHDRELIAGRGILPIGDFTENRTISIDEDFAFEWTGPHSHTDEVSHPGFTAGSDPTHWGIFPNAAYFQYLRAREMRVSFFGADETSVTSGIDMTIKSWAYLALPFTVPAPGASSLITFEDLPIARGIRNGEEGDIWRVRQNTVFLDGELIVEDCWGVVSGYTPNDDGTQTWTFTRSTGVNAGAMTVPYEVPVENTICVDYGTDGNGYWIANAIEGPNASLAPFADIVRWTGHPATGQVTHVRMGNLRGITVLDPIYMTVDDDSFFNFDDDELWEIEVPEFGLWTGTGVTNQFVAVTDQRIEAHGLNLSMYNASNVQVIRLDASVPSIAVGATLPTTYGEEGIWFGMESGLAKASIGNSEEYVRWDGEALIISGEIHVIAGGNAATQDYAKDYTNERRVLSVSGTWTPTSYNSVSWGTPDNIVIKLANGNAVLISDNSATSLAARTYVWLDHSSIIADMAGFSWGSSIPIDPENILIAIIDPSADTGVNASVRVVAGTTWISGDQIVTGAIKAGKIDVANLSALTISSVELTVDLGIGVGEDGKIYSSKGEFTGSGTGWLIEHNSGTPQMFVGTRVDGVLTNGFEWYNGIFNIKSAQSVDFSPISSTVADLSINDITEEGFIDVNMRIGSGLGNFNFGVHVTDGGNTGSGVSALYMGISTTLNSDSDNMNSDGIDKIFAAYAGTDPGLEFLFHNILNVTNGFYAEIGGGIDSPGTLQLDNNGVPFWGKQRGNSPVAIFNRQPELGLATNTAPAVLATNGEANGISYRAIIGNTGQVAYDIQPGVWGADAIALDCNGTKIEMNGGDIDGADVITAANVNTTGSIVVGGAGGISIATTALDMRGHPLQDVGTITLAAGTFYTGTASWVIEGTAFTAQQEGWIQMSIGGTTRLVPYFSGFA